MKIDPCKHSLWEWRRPSQEHRALSSTKGILDDACNERHGLDEAISDLEQHSSLDKELAGTIEIRASAPFSREQMTEEASCSPLSTTPRPRLLDPQVLQ